MTDFSLGSGATMEKVFLRIAGGEEGLAQSRLGREIAEMLQAGPATRRREELDAVVFSEATCCGCAVRVAAPVPPQLRLEYVPFVIMVDGRLGRVAH